MAFEPWNKYPGLTRERLQIVAGIMRRARQDTADLHDSPAGDNGWSLGCRAYSRTCFALRKAVGDYIWLTMVREEQNYRFTFAIGGIPIRFYHGESNGAPDKYAALTDGELRQYELAFETKVEISEVLRISIETDKDGNPTAITLVQLDKDNKPIDTYTIPNDDGKVVPLQQKGIVLPKPKVEPIKTKEEKKRKGERDAG